MKTNQGNQENFMRGSKLQEVNSDSESKKKPMTHHQQRMEKCNPSFSEVWNELNLIVRNLSNLALIQVLA